MLGGCPRLVKMILHTVLDSGRNNQTHNLALLPSELTVTCDLQELQSLRNNPRIMHEAVVIQGIVRGC
ncbi:unnamed protein product [Dicrocoelium dendriticum]|nr:unnamed protein product [Dicrocoelium dendriticum]